MASLDIEARLDNLLATAQEETKDIDLFAPLPEREECPICMIPLPIKEEETIFMTCCGKHICSGCIYKSVNRDRENGVPRHKIKCAFCCQPTPKNNLKENKKLMKRKNPDAFMQMAVKYESGEGVFQSDTKALEMRINAAERGLAQAFSIIALNYMEGDTVEQNTSKAFEFSEVAAKKGSSLAHEQLASFHLKNCDMNTGIKHLKVAACAGEKELDSLMRLYKKEFVSKEDLTQTLRAYQESNDLTKSKDRDDARAFYARKSREGKITYI